MLYFGLAEPVWRLAAFAAAFAALAALELFHPRLERPELMRALKARRWITNLSILVLSSLLLRVAFPAAATGVAIWLRDADTACSRLSASPRRLPA